MLNWWCNDGLIMVDGGWCLSDHSQGRLQRKIVLGHQGRIPSPFAAPMLPMGTRSPRGRAIETVKTIISQQVYLDPNPSHAHLDPPAIHNTFPNVPSMTRWIQPLSTAKTLSHCLLHMRSRCMPGLTDRFHPLFLEEFRFTSSEPGGSLLVYLDLSRVFDCVPRQFYLRRSRRCLWSVALSQNRRPGTRLVGTRQQAE